VHAIDGAASCAASPSAWLAPSRVVQHARWNSYWYLVVASLDGIWLSESFIVYSVSMLARHISMLARHISMLARHISMLARHISMLARHISTMHDPALTSVQALRVALYASFGAYTATLIMCWGGIGLARCWP
jgi:hypothetical protein